MEYTISAADYNREQLSNAAPLQENAEAALNLQISRLIRHAISPAMAASIASLVFGGAK